MVHKIYMYLLARILVTIDVLVMVNVVL